MPSPPEQFLLSGPAGLLAALIPVFVADLDIELVSVSGPAAAPELIVARTSPDRADLLSRALGGQLRVEPDAEIGPAARPVVTPAAPAVPTPPDESEGRHR